MAKQEIKPIKVSELRLWTENPRDPMDTKSTDFDVIKRAIDDNPAEWNLDKLIKEMGNHYDFSEIPTVVYLENVPMVFDYVLHTDVTDCYGAIYTHSISWALHDKEIAKENRNKESLLGNRVDRQLQAMSNGQTNGIPQGSVLMDLLAELVLCYADSLLAKKIQSIARTEYRVIRYRDDYRIFTNHSQIAEQMRM